MNPASTGAGTAGPALTRRERHRQATYDEIVSVARALLRSSSTDLSLRAVAAEMGMTPPALYRYVDSYAGSSCSSPGQCSPTSWRR